ncbi:hypothetical protein [Pantoea allii]|uniref:hypothetical protein n=1 Tax=Pantoea allii TaxID=574096 RepID=UPI0024B7CFD5|nr:hypothetical protein [Pantoea allii]MDJ0087674.1 hypothetical protein [Pantoea allii]
MKIDKEQLYMVVYAIGRVVIEIRAEGKSLTDTEIIERLEHYRRLETNTIGKGVYRDAAELVRSGKWMV